ncbi:MAG: sugar ABC transporter permease, partial [Proteobacteria bacterium]|nr:sugar ABC transporter permease [Pseudomonadota bacterium]
MSSIATAKRSSVFQERKEEKRINRIKKELKNSKVSYMFIAPYLILFCLFTMLPVVISMFFSFTYFNILELPKFIGFDNYIKLFLYDDIFLTAIKNTIVFALVTGPVSYMLSLIFAWIINELTPKIRAFVTLVFYAPSISGNVYLVWTIMFSGDSYGYINGILMQRGVIADPIQWFQDKDYILPLVIVVALWTSIGTSFLAFIAGLQDLHTLQVAVQADSSHYGYITEQSDINPV